MTDDTSRTFDFIILGLILGMVILFFVGFVGRGVEIDRLKHEAIQKNYAIYNPTNGNWQWK
jgi:hypothetical protein